MREKKLNETLGGQLSDVGPSRLGLPTAHESREVVKWQTSLLPFVRGMIVILTVSFVIATAVQLRFFQRQIEDSPRITLDETLKPLGYDAREPPENKLIYAQWKTLSLLEAASVEKRYHQAGLLLTARVSVIYFGFITGMILALVGATFILGKFRDEPHAVMTRQKFEGGMQKAACLVSVHINR
jgi:hypothetical protein